MFAPSIEATEEARSTITSKGASKTTAPQAYVETTGTISAVADPITAYMSREQLQKTIDRTRRNMKEAAKRLEFIEAAQYRDETLRLEELMKERFGE